jgi:hypothetical protein
MVQACLVLKLKGLEEEGSGEAGGVTSVVLSTLVDLQI